MNIAICDDELEYVKCIKKHIELFLSENNLSANIDVFTDGSILLNSDKHYDIAFLDIEIEDIKGTDIAINLKENNEYIIVFIITAHNEYLDDAMDLNVLRFILKPLQTDRLYAGLKKALSLIDNTKVELYLKEDNSLRKIFVNDIIYVEIVGRSTRVVTTNNTYVSRNKINYWKDILKPSFFFQVHSSFIINMKHITRYKRNLIVLDDKYEVPVSYRKQTEFKNYFTNYFSGR